MPTRTRPFVSSDRVEFPNGSVSTNHYNGIKEFISEVRRKKGVSDVVHRKYLSFASGYLGRIGQNRHFIFNSGNWDLVNGPLPAEVNAQLYSTHSAMLDSLLEKPSFELIPFLADIDSTLAMFSRKFLRDLSYGSVTWGVLPFVSDVKALLTSLKTIFNAGGPSCKRVSLKRPIAYAKSFASLCEESRVTYPVVSVVGETRLNGYVVYNRPDMNKLINKALFLADQLGVHPDLKTAWDIIPLSFVVDYFLPIGSLLESLHPRGWGSSAVTFTGYQSSSYTVEIATCYKQGSELFNHIPSFAKVYGRWYYDGLVRPSSPQIEWSAPSMKEIFNTAYLTTALKRAF
jgi:hypothetical protein